MSESERNNPGSEPQMERDLTPAIPPPSLDVHQSETKTISAAASDFSFSIWPPTQKTRDAVISRLVETLSTESVLSKRYGTLSRDEASEVARCIEEEAFAVSGTIANPASNDVEEGIEILQVYSKEISKRMLETVKSRAEIAKVNKTDEGVPELVEPKEAEGEADGQ